MQIVFRAGYYDAVGSPPDDDIDVVPMRFRQAIKLHAEAHYDRDSTMMPILLKVAEDLIRPERVEMGMA